MKPFSNFARGILLMSALASSPALAATFVYVSNAEDGEIGAYSMQADGALKALVRTQAAKVVMPMAVSPNRRLLYAASRSKPYTVHVYAIDPGTGALKPLSTAPLADSFPYISLDRNGRFLFCASYGGTPAGVQPSGADRRTTLALPVIPPCPTTPPIHAAAPNPHLPSPHRR